MRTLVVVENLSLDGVMQAPGREDEDERGGFTHGGWASRMLADDPDGEGELVVLGGAPAGRRGAGRQGPRVSGEFQLTILPVVLGVGTRLFGDTHTELEPIRTQAFGSGAVVARYRVAGVTG